MDVEFDALDQGGIGIKIPDQVPAGWFSCQAAKKKLQWQIFSAKGPRHCWLPGCISLNILGLSTHIEAKNWLYNKIRLEIWDEMLKNVGYQMFSRLSSKLPFHNKLQVCYPKTEWKGLFYFDSQQGDQFPNLNSEFMLNFMLISFRMYQAHWGGQKWVCAAWDKAGYKALNMYHHIH